MTNQTSKVKLKKNVENGKHKGGNPRNFLSLIQLAADLDCPVLKEHVSKCPKNATYTSKTIQNEIVDICANRL